MSKRWEKKKRNEKKNDLRFFLIYHIFFYYSQMHTYPFNCAHLHSPLFSRQSHQINWQTDLKMVFRMFDAIIKIIWCFVKVCFEISLHGKCSQRRQPFKSSSLLIVQSIQFLPRNVVAVCLDAWCFIK